MLDLFLMLLIFFVIFLFGGLLLLTNSYQIIKQNRKMIAILKEIKDQLKTKNDSFFR
ncbi:hypothetical protein [Chengkuizengella sediminis]|uniref:hypothetical protein n=1 Tax=Chengkuizengella sediminis TaxID=1885917 RepID=UPI00138944BE|nr:hypothetical protein [Chengkuizengella sediminis]NDI35474.1 hypothetical protein [Chengkuizengella sediminis]